jgi:hypothetical protein
MTLNTKSVVHCNLKTWPLIQFLQELTHASPHGEPVTNKPDRTNDILELYLNGRGTMSALLNGKAVQWDNQVKGLTPIFTKLRLSGYWGSSASENHSHLVLESLHEGKHLVYIQPDLRVKIIRLKSEPYPADVPYHEIFGGHKVWKRVTGIHGYQVCDEQRYENLDIDKVLTEFSATRHNA